KKIEEIKETWEGLWTPHANRVLRDANKGMSIGIRLMERYGYFTGRSADLFSQIVEAAERLSGNGGFLKDIEATLSYSFANAGTFLRIMENLMPVAAAIAVSTTKVTSEVLLGVEGWSETYTYAEKIEEVQ